MPKPEEIPACAGMTKKRVVWFIISPMLRRLFCILLALAVAPTAAADAKSVFAKAAPSVVVVVAQDGGGEQTSQGSGVVVGEGVAVTNCHVIESAAKVSIRQAADSQAAETYLMNAEVVARDEDNDLCLLYAPDLSKPPAAKTATMGNAKNLVIGEEVYAIGAPQGLELSLSRGIVAQLRGVKGKAPIVQTDAAISPGSSGGGLFNEDGELVGVTTFGDKERQGLNFAMPVEEVVGLIPKAKQGIAEAARWQTCIAKPGYQCAMALAEQAAQKLGAYKNMSQNDKDRSWMHVGVAQAEAGDINGAKQTAQQVGSPLLWKDTVLESIAIAQIGTGDINGAKQTAQKINSEYSRVEILQQCVLAQTKAGDISGAKQTAQEIYALASDSYLVDASTPSQVLADIAVVQTKAGDVVGAEQTFTESLRAAQKNTDALIHIAVAKTETGDIEGAKEILSDALLVTLRDESDYAKARDLSSIAVAKYEIGDVADAKQLLSDALRFAGRIDLSYSRFGGLKNIAAAQVKIGDIKNANKIAVNALPALERLMRLCRDSSQKCPSVRLVQEDGTDTTGNRLIGDMANVLITAGNISGAKDAVHKMDASYEHGRYHVVEKIVVAQAKSGDINGAKQTARLYPTGEWYRENLLRIVVSVQAEQGDVNGAMQTMRQINYVDSQAESFLAIAVAQAKAGNIKDAKEYFKSAVRYAQQAQQQQEGDYSYSSLPDIAIAQAETGDFSGAMRTAKLINYDTRFGEKSEALAHIAKLLAKR